MWETRREGGRPIKEGRAMMGRLGGVEFGLERRLEMEL